MALTKTDVLFVFLFRIFLIFEVNLAQGAVVGRDQSALTVTHDTRFVSSGICYLEVRTVDLPSEEYRRNIVPGGNEPKLEFSKIQVCCAGWRRKAHSPYQCEPVCDNGCPNGNCTAPNVCICLAGHIRDLDNNCVPTCPRGCLNGVCTLQGKCSCTPGYRLDPKGQFCVPYCIGGCGTGGKCTAPGVCSCKPGYERDPASGECRYHCAGDCPGGECVAPNHCLCTPGYVRRNKVCVAEPCSTGNCTATVYLKITPKKGK